MTTSSILAVIQPAVVQVAATLWSSLEPVALRFLVGSHNGHHEPHVAGLGNRDERATAKKVTSRATFALVMELASCVSDSVSVWGLWHSLCVMQSVQG